MTATWKCGHERTEANTQGIGDGRTACKECRRAISRRWYHNHRDKALASLAARREAKRERIVAEAAEAVAAVCKAAGVPASRVAHWIEQERSA